MTRAWFGILPPPKGHGYYPAEIDLPDYFVGQPPLTTTLGTNATSAPSALWAPPEPGPQPFQFRLEEDQATIDFSETIDREVRRITEAVNAGLVAAATSVIVEHLRSKGYTITEPEATS